MDDGHGTHLSPPALHSTVVCSTHRFGVACSINRGSAWRRFSIFFCHKSFESVAKIGIEMNEKIQRRDEKKKKNEKKKNI